MELNEKWLLLANKEGLELNPANEEKQYVYRLAFADGAQTYADAVEKMFISYKEKYQTIIDSRNSIQEEINHARIMLAHTNKQLEELKSIQP